MSEKSYWTRVLTRVVNETAVFTIKKLLVGLVVGLIARLSLLEFGHKALREIGLDTSIFIGSYIFVFIFSVLVNLIRVPALIDADCRREIADLSMKLELPDRAKAEYIRGLFSKISANAVKVLQFVLFHEEIDTPHMKVDGLDFKEMQKGRQECLEVGLIRIHSEGYNDAFSITAMMRARDYYYVPSEFRETLKRLLYSSPNG